MVVRTPLQWPDKDPDEVLDHIVDWNDSADPVLASGETISTVTWDVPSGLVLDSQSNTTTTATAVLSGGTAGVKYQVSCKIVTDSSPARTFERTVNLKVKER